jgi:hypothetical protein
MLFPLPFLLLYPSLLLQIPLLMLTAARHDPSGRSRLFLLVFAMFFQPLSYLFCLRMLFPLLFLLLSSPLFLSTASFFLL